MSSRHKKGRNRQNNTNAAIIPTFYPPMPGYPVPGSQWMTLPPGTDNPYQWFPSWPNVPSVGNQNFPWMPPQTGDDKVVSLPTSKSALQPVAPEEYTVDSMRRIYNDDDGRIEIERVKVQRRQGIYDTKQSTLKDSTDSQSLVPVSMAEIRPPPRKNRKKGTKASSTSEQKQGEMPPQGWYPFMPYLPQPFPYLYPYGYAWPMPPPSSIFPPGCRSPTDSDSSLSHQGGFPVSMNSPDLVPENTRSPELVRPSSSAATSHITESLGTDIAPSDSVSMRGFKRETSIERILRKSLSNPSQPDKERIDNLNEDDIEKTKEWMEDMQKAFESKSATALSDMAGDRSSFATAPSDIPTPPTKHKTVDTVNKSKITHRKSNSESNIENPDDQRCGYSVPLLDNTRVSESDLIYFIKKQGQATDDFGLEDNAAASNLENKERKKASVDKDGRVSRTSTTSFHSTRQSGDDNHADTDSTDIAIPIDSSTTDESMDNFEGENAVDDYGESNYKWILQSAGESSEDKEAEEEEPSGGLIESWRTEVSLWRARLVVSLCRGQGLDQQDWATFQLLVQHPLTLDLKLSLLHARRICSRNYDVGVALLRNALLHLTTFGESLMKPEAERPNGWKTVAIDANQPWVPVKGSMEILRVFGYRSREEGFLKYGRKYAPETSMVARLTLDLLVLAEEFRLFLTGSHQYPMNITQLFSSREFHSEKHSLQPFEPSSQCDEPQDGQKKSETDNCLQSSKFKLSKEVKAEAKGKDDIRYENKSGAECDLLTEASTVSVEENVSLETPANFSPQPSDLRSSTTSIPELQSRSLGSGMTVEGQESTSRETLLASPIHYTSDSKSTDDKTLNTDEPVSIVENKKEHSKRTSRRRNGKDNPEDHIYEEIGDIKAQIELLKDADSVSRSPPPLPPKTKVSSQSQDIYPHVDWSISSQYSSIHSGSGAKRKKRRAPMPPEFLSQEDLNENKSISTSVAEKQLCSDQEGKLEPEVQAMPFNGNPFYEERIKPAGYIGKNPFYEDITKGAAEENAKDIQHEETSISSSQVDKIPNNVDMLHKENDDLSEASESLPAGVRPQRRKNKDKTLRKNQKASKTQFCQNNDISSEDGKGLSKHESLISSTTMNKKKQEQNAKNEEGEPQRGSQVAVPNEESETERQERQNAKNIGKKDVIFQKISITYDISLDDSTSSRNKTVIPPIPVKLKNLKERLNEKLEVKLKPKAKTPTDSTCNVGHSEQDKKSETHMPTDDDFSAINTPETSPLEVKETSTEEKHSSKKSPVREENVISDETDVKDSSCPPISSQSPDLPPLPPPKPAFRLLDDIPYIDTNDVKSYKSDYSSSERKQPPRCGIGEICPQSSDNDFTVKNESSPALSMLLDVPFIDDADAPPDSPPPFPPLSVPPLTPLQDSLNSQLFPENVNSVDISETSSKCASQTSSLLHVQQTSQPSSLSETTSESVTRKDVSSLPPLPEKQTPISLSQTVLSQSLEHKVNSPSSETPTLTPLSQTPNSTCPSDTSPKETEISCTLSEASTYTLGVQISNISTQNFSFPSPEAPALIHLPKFTTQPLEQTSNDTSTDESKVLLPSLSPPTYPHILPNSATQIIPPPPNPPFTPPPPTPPLTPPPETPSLISFPPAPPLHPPPPTPSLYPSASQTLATSTCESPIHSVNEPLLSDTQLGESECADSENSPKREAIDMTNKTISINTDERKEKQDDTQQKFQEAHAMLSSESATTPMLDAGKGELDESSPKSIVVFGADKNPKPSGDTTVPKEDPHETPMPSRPTSDFEERYEIPDVTRAEAFDKAHPEARVSSRNLLPKSPAKSKDTGIPKRPPRHLQAFTIPPPRPPKPSNLESPPDLPPKIGGSLKSVKSSGSATNELTASLPSTLCRVKDHKQDLDLPTPVDPKIQSDHASPSTNSKSSTNKAFSMSAISSNKTTSKTNPSATVRSLSKTSYPPSKSVSMPSSPKVSKNSSKIPKKDDSKQRSWPFQICDCVYPKRSNKDVEHVINST